MYTRVGVLYTHHIAAQDHCKACYAPDLRLAEASGLFGPGSWLIADNVIYPGAPDLLTALTATDRYVSTIVPLPHEVDQPWNPRWEPQPDGMAIAVGVEGLRPEQAAAAMAQLAALCSSLRGEVCTPLTVQESVNNRGVGKTVADEM
jgi:hypothetical protein